MLRFVAGKIATDVARDAALRHSLRALLFKLLLATETVIRVAAVDKAAGGGAIEFHAIGLEVRPFVPVDAEPAQADKNAFHHLRSGALQVSVFNAENQRAAVVSRIEPVEQSGTRSADVQVAGGRRCEAKPGRIGNLGLHLPALFAFFDDGVDQSFLYSLVPG